MNELALATGGRVVGDAERVVSGISTDSRTVKTGELFVPLRGEKFDGHDYITGLPDVGVMAFLADERWLQHNSLPEGASSVVVRDTLRALGNIAHAWRKKFDLPLIGVTGSNGKTTTKEMLASILGLTGEGLATEGNLNNLIGLPRMLLKLGSEHRWAVLEMGMSEPGEIDRLAEIAMPGIGIVLNAYPAHLKSMGTVEAVAKAKGELLGRISDNGLAVVNADDPRIVSLPQNSSARRISFGIRRGEVRGENIRSIGLEGQVFTLLTHKGSCEVRIAACGEHNVSNALAAAAALVDMLPLETIAEGLARFRPYSGRFNIEQFKGFTLIDDSYNANPASTGAALATISEIKGGKKAFVALGDMLELGGEEALMHRMIGFQAGKMADRLYLIGGLANEMARGALEAGMPEGSVCCGMDHESVAEDIAGRVGGGELVLVKGSRGMRMEKIAEALRRKFR